MPAVSEEEKHADGKDIDDQVLTENNTCPVGLIESEKDSNLVKQPSFGICFDVDGVLARGTLPIPEATKTFPKLVNEEGNFLLPVCFVTNSLNRTADRANQLSEFLGVKVSCDQMIQAPTPLKAFSELHDKFCLIVGQGKMLEISQEFGFHNTCSIEEVSEAYPLLDVVDHDNRKKNSLNGHDCVEKKFPRVEAIILMGEPKRWESALQIIVDLLRSGGNPSNLASYDAQDPTHEQIPIVACNMDLQFKDRAPTPRFGHGAFLVCLEELYKKLTGFDLAYYALVGKPSEITFRFTEHVLTSQSVKLGYTKPIKTMYLIGDTPEVDIAGSNLYQKYIDRLTHIRSKNSKELAAVIDSASTVTSADLLLLSEELFDPELPESRNVPRKARFHRQTLERIVPILVCTGVYRRDARLSDESEDKFYHGHRDFARIRGLDRPALVLDDVGQAIEYILSEERFTAH